MLQLLSDKYNVSINEILSGERLADGEHYKAKAEENIKTALNKSVFTLKDQENYFHKKWLKDHRFELILEIIVLTAIAVLGAIFHHPVTIAASILCIVWFGFTYNRMRTYIEYHLYDNKKPEDYKTKNE